MLLTTIVILYYILFDLQLDYNATGKVAYAWNTSMDKFQLPEIILFWIIALLVLSTAIIFAIGLPRLLKCTLDLDSGGLGFELGNVMQMDIDYNWRIIRTLKTVLHSQIRYTILFSTLGISIVAGAITIFAGLKVTRSTGISVFLGIFSFIVYMLTINLIIDSIPLVMFTFIYPVEMITTISFIVAAIVGIGILEGKFWNGLLTKNTGLTKDQRWKNVIIAQSVYFYSSVPTLLFLLQLMDCLSYIFHC